MIEHAISNEQFNVNTNLHDDNRGSDRARGAGRGSDRARGGYRGSDRARGGGRGGCGEGHT